MQTKKQNILFSILSLAVVAVVSFMLVQPVYASAMDGKGGPGGRGAGVPGVPSGTGASVTPLSDAEKDALTRAILEEYGALNLYDSVVAKFGDVAPFAQIARSEQQHVNALVRQATKYGVTVPSNPGLTSPPSFEALNVACQAGVQAEIADAALYDELKPAVTHADILQVFSNLQNASLTSHLPAFQTCR